ncbi:unnamed protein product [Merluccius merluccius]
MDLMESSLNWGRLGPHRSARGRDQVQVSGSEVRLRTLSAPWRRTLQQRSVSRTRSVRPGSRGFTWKEEVLCCGSQFRIHGWTQNHDPTRPDPGFLTGEEGVWSAAMLAARPV